MSEKLQRGRGLINRFKDGLGQITEKFVRGRVFERSGEEVQYDESCQESCLNIQIYSPRHERVILIRLDEVEEVRRQLAVELVKIRGRCTDSCQVNLGYTPGSTFFRTKGSVEVNLNTDEIYLLLNQDELPEERKKRAMKILRRGVKVMEDEEVSLLDSRLIDQRGRTFRIRKKT